MPSVFLGPVGRDVVPTSIASPDRTKSVVVFRKVCGVTVPDTTHAGQPSAFVGYDQLDTTFFSVADTPEVLSSWRGNDAVEIALIPGGGRVLKREPKVGDVTIEYE